ncbi:LL-diaminopimelate aminotransferase [bacterium]|nr:LL-diaminopimelate aminotransferase [bacterium]
MEFSDRINQLPPYLFVELDKLKKQAISEGADIISLGIGDPDMGTPEVIVKSLNEAAKDPSNHHYALDEGMPIFKKSIADWYKRRFDVELNASNEILPCLGSKDGIGHIHLAFVNPGDVVLVPDPGYPVYRSGTIFTGGEVVYMPLLEKNGFLPDLDIIPEEKFKKAKLMFLNYPNNPTAACATKEFFEKVISLAKKYNIIVCHDAAYSEVCFDGYKPLSFLEIKGAKEVGIEMHSLSKTFNMTGWRVGFAVGNSEVIKGLAKIKSNVDSGVFQAIQLAGKTALDNDKIVPEIMKEYQARRDVLVKGLRDLGWDVPSPKATFYVWTKLPKGYTSSMDFVKLLIKETGIVTTPGVGFGEYGEGYVRMALTVNVDRIKEALKRIKKVL